mgnify:FL=1
MCPLCSFFNRLPIGRITIVGISVVMVLCPWWNPDFTKRIPILVTETNGYQRTNSYILVDLSSQLTAMGLRDLSGADIRIVGSNDTALLSSRVIHRVGGTAAAVVFLANLTNATNASGILCITNTNYLYYNYSDSAGDIIPAVPASGKMKTRRGYERYYEPGLDPVLYFLRVGVIGGYSDVGYIRSALKIAGNQTPIPFDTTDYDVLIYNRNDTYMRTNVAAFQKFIQSGGGFLDSDVSLRAGDSIDRWLTCNLPFFDMFHLGYLPFTTAADIMDDGVRTGVAYVTNTNHFVSMNITDMPTAKIIEVFNVYPYLFRTWFDRHIQNIPIDRDLGNSGQSGINVSDYRTAPYDSNSSIINNGRYGMCSFLSFLSATNITDLGKRLITRQFVWVAGLDDLGVGYPPDLTLGALEVNNFVKTLLLNTESPSFLSGAQLAGTITYYSNMDTAQTPVMVFSNMNTTVTYAISMGAGSSWTTPSTYTFTGTYASTPIPGKYAIIIRSNNMIALPAIGAGNDYSLRNIYYDTAGRWSDYRCIPQVLSRAGTGNLGSTTVLVSSPSATTITAVVYNKKGVPVRTLVRDGTLDLTRNIIWDGKNDNGIAAITGMYVIKLDIRGRGTFYARVRIVD